MYKTFPNSVLASDQVFWVSLGVGSKKIISLSLVLLFDLDLHLGVSFLGHNTCHMVIVVGNSNQTASLNSENKWDSLKSELFNFYMANKRSLFVD